MRLNTAEAPASVPPGTALRWKAPRVGERRVSSRKPAVARPSRRTCGASRRDDGEPVSSPRLSGQGKKRCFATRGARSDRGWGEVSGVSNHFGECRDSVSSRPLALRTPGGRLRWQRFTSVIERQPSHPRFGGLGCSSGPSSCSWKHFICRSRRSACGPRNARDSGAPAGLVGAFEAFELSKRLVNTCSGSPRRPARAALH